MLICPHCKKELIISNRAYICENNHCFDISKFAHTNLLVTNKQGDNIGDSKEMVRARASFLEKDYYLPLAEKICSLIPEKDKISYLDCGCGEGYYSSIITKSLTNSKCFATDISKNAVMFASKKDKQTSYFVSSVFDLPIKENSIDLLTCIFAPLAENEFRRVVKNKGYIIVVTAGTEHLFELKKAVYDSPYKNDEDKHVFSNFTLIKKEKLLYKVKINSNEDIKNLFAMTPYNIKTSREDKAKLDKIDNIELTLDFVITVLANK